MIWPSLLMVATSGMLDGGLTLRTGQCRPSPFNYCWLGGVSRGCLLGVSWLYITFTQGTWITPQPSLFGGTCGDCSGAGSNWRCLKAFHWLILTSWKICCLPGTGQQSVSAVHWRTWTRNSHHQTRRRTWCFNLILSALLDNPGWLDFLGTRFRVLRWLHWLSPTLWRMGRSPGTGRRSDLALLWRTRTRSIHHRTRPGTWSFSLILANATSRALRMAEHTV